MRNIVTDGQLGQLAVKQHELFQRGKKGVYASFDEMLDALQLVIEGKPPIIPTLAVEDIFTKWRTFQVGSRDNNHFLARVARGHETGLFSTDLDTYPVTQDWEDIDTVVLTPADFGYERMPDTKELFSPSRLDTWSRLNVHRLGGCFIQLLPVQAGPYVLEQYKDQPKGEILFLAMERISNNSNVPRIFSIRRFADDGRQYLHASDLRSNLWNPYSPIVFRLHKIV